MKMSSYFKEGNIEAPIILISFDAEPTQSPVGWPHTGQGSLYVISLVYLAQRGEASQPLNALPSSSRRDPVKQTSLA